MGERERERGKTLYHNYASAAIARSWALQKLTANYEITRIRQFLL